MFFSVSFCYRRMFTGQQRFSIVSLFVYGSEPQFLVQRHEMLISECTARRTILSNARSAVTAVAACNSLNVPHI